MSNTIIGIAGGTGSGKTTFAREVAGRFSGEAVTVISQDSYYRDLERLDPGERDRTNFDHPDAIDKALLAEHMRRLKDGKAIEKPVYDFKTHLRLREAERVEPRGIVLLEGIFVLGVPEIRELLDIKIFVDADPDLRFIRRLERDIRHRGRSPESVIEQYVAFVRPMHVEFVEHTRRFADLIVPGGGFNSAAVDLVVSRIEAILNE